MAEQKTTQGKTAAVAPKKGGGTENRSIGLGVRLTPIDDSDLPVVSNYTALNVSPGMAFIDFGFIEPGMLAALPRLVQQGSKLPENINCKLAVRVAMGYEALANLQQQLTQVLSSVQANNAGVAKK